MNILTKICVVVLLVLVLVASVLFVNMATVAPNWRKYYEQEKNRAELNGQSVRVQKLANTRQKERIDSLLSDKTTLQRQVAQLQGQLVPNPADVASKVLLAKLEAANTNLLKLGQSVDAMGQRNDLLTKQLDSERAKTTALQAQIARVTTDMTQVRGDLERSQQVVRAMEKQLHDRDERIAELEKQVAGTAPATTSGTAVAAAPQGQVTGTITAVRGEHASINVGASQGVAQGQRFFIYRNASFVGYLTIDEVDQGEAAGTIVDKQLDPVIGDKVTNDLTVTK